MCRIDKPLSPWEAIKAKGSDHYKTGEVEPIDLYKSAGILQDFAIGNIIKYAYRLKKKGVNSPDIDKIIHYAEMLKVVVFEDALTATEFPEGDGDENASAL